MTQQDEAQQNYYSDLAGEQTLPTTTTTTAYQLHDQNDAAPTASAAALQTSDPDAVAAGEASKSDTTSPSESRASIPTACLPCVSCLSMKISHLKDVIQRSKHLKCDGSHPCTRCTRSGSECLYVASRRGYKGPRRAVPTASSTSHNPNKRQAVSPAETGSDAPLPGMNPDTTPGGSAGGICPFTGRSIGSSVAKSRSSVSVSSPGSSSSASGHPSTDGSSLMVSPDRALVPNNYLATVHPTAVLPQPTSLAERCIDSFYRHFHAAHPFVLPRRHLLQMSASDSLEPLLAAMRWVGSLFIDVSSSRASLYDEAHQRVRDPATPRDGFLVQALMVLIVGLDGSCRNEEARHLLEDVERLAIEIALNTRPFAVMYGRGMPVLEESWRRTWWDLFVIDGMIAGVHRVTNFALFDFPADVGLPCEERDYLSGNIPSTVYYLEDLEDHDFQPDPPPSFSSFAYRIANAQTMGKVMRSPIVSAQDENLTRIDALLTNWELHLPPSKRGTVLDATTGLVDEMLFQAHMMYHAITVLLHQPHSQLDSSPAASVNSCAPHRDVAHGMPFNTHTHRTLAAAAAITLLVTTPGPVASHTHFFTCVLTLSSIVHLSRWALSSVQYDDDDLRQHIRLCTGALSHLSRVWPAAERARGQVRGVAREIYQAKKAVQGNSDYWFGVTRDQMMRSITADDTIIQEVEAEDGGRKQLDPN